MLHGFNVNGCTTLEEHQQLLNEELSLEHQFVILGDIAESPSLSKIRASHPLFGALLKLYW